MRSGFLSYFDEVADLLTPMASANQFEESLKNLGTILGFEAQRPDHEFGKGPDNLWILDDKKALVISVKSRKKEDNPLTKNEHAQLLEDFEWFRQEYPELNGYKVVVHPNTLSLEGVTTADTFAFTLGKLRTLLTHTRELISHLCEIPTATNARIECDNKLMTLNLTPDKIIATFLKEFSTV
jgi:hypothetical protein